MIETLDTAVQTYTAKLDALRQKLRQFDLDAWLLTDLSNIAWLTGFRGSNATVLLTDESAWLFTDGRYAEQVKIEVKNAEPVITPDGVLEELKSGKYPVSGRVGFQADKLPFATVEKLCTELPHLTFVPHSGVFDELLAVKSSDELEKIKAAVAITDKVFEKLLEIISPKVTERDIAAEISYWNKKFGAERDAFEPIVASGSRAALPHARASHHFIENHSLVVIDMGCVVDGYCSDQTRTVAVGKISAEARRAYHTVLEAHLLGIHSARVGMQAKELDAIVRQFLSERGYGEAFSHSLGHSIGMQVHEVPTIGRKSEMRLPKGAVFTIEPGVYVPHQFGVRIEDMVYLTDEGALPLPRAPKHLIEL
ncbi:MAG: Xaa-Pro peptidase family protein [Chloroherpetonaceae bacterium]|nr:Xaa-Pro peptidase family protein [Chloroherpetonaceae bacterium]MCS7211340.1 Xaa-Pro peptidase family protein [Chloroherpetonaceae bacterium]MDW8020388.1 Xaa-Pro peptidase family protein [Chloroherpetonaceae bacterium]